VLRRGTWGQVKKQRWRWGVSRNQSLKNLNGLGQGDTVNLLQRVMALAKELKQQVTWRCVEKQSGARPDTSAKPQACHNQVVSCKQQKGNNECN